MQYTKEEVADTDAFAVTAHDLDGFSPDVEEKIDDMLLQSVAQTKTPTVKAGQAQSESRAWSFGGNVD